MSYSHADKEIAKKIANELMGSGIDVWLDEWEIQAGDPILQKIFREGLPKAEVFLILISNSSTKSKWVQEELDQATLKRIEGSMKIIPLVAENCRIPEQLQVLKWVDLSKNFDGGIFEVVKSIFEVSEKPPIGSVPDYISEPNKVVGGLSRNASTIGFILLKGGDSLRGDEKGYDGKELKSLASMLNEGEINDAVAELEDHGLVTTLNFFGTALFDFGLVKPTYALFLHFKDNGVEYDPFNDIKSVASAVSARNEKIGGRLIQEITGLDPLRINRAVAYLEDYGKIDAIHAMGTAPFDFYHLQSTWKTRQFVDSKCR